MSSPSPPSLGPIQQQSVFQDPQIVMINGGVCVKTNDTTSLYREDDLLAHPPARHPRTSSQAVYQPTDNIKMGHQTLVLRIDNFMDGMSMTPPAHPS